MKCHVLPPQPEECGPDGHLIRHSAKENCDFIDRSAADNLHAQIVIIDIRPRRADIGSQVLIIVHRVSMARREQS
jgi:hypothetical protein